jgi:hypothetical protein
MKQERNNCEGLVVWGLRSAQPWIHYSHSLEGRLVQEALREARLPCTFNLLGLKEVGGCGDTHL